MRKERVLEAKEAIKRQRKTRNMKRWASPNDQNLNYYKCFQMNQMIIILNSLYNLFHMLPSVKRQKPPFYIIYYLLNISVLNVSNYIVNKQACAIRKYLFIIYNIQYIEMQI